MANPRQHPLAALAVLGPGLAIAATGVGAGDLMAAMLAGASFGHTLAWVIVLGAVLKLCLNEGVARWQLATGSTLLEGWCRHLGRGFQLYFLVYLVVWGFIVAGGLMSACGVAAHAVLPALSIRSWGILHSLVAAVLVLAGSYGLFERVMKSLVALMVLTLLLSAALLLEDLPSLLRGLVLPMMPALSATTILSLMGGVGGSVTLLSYGYWIREKGWRGGAYLGSARLDLAVGYLLTGLFGVAMLVLSAAVLGGEGGGLARGSAGLVACGQSIREAASAEFGSAAGHGIAMVFLLGVWAAVATSTLGVWQGVPYLFADFTNVLRGLRATAVDTRAGAYRGFLAFLAVPPMLLLFLERPLWVVKLYTVTGSLFMPVLAGSLLWLNSRPSLVGEHRNGPLTTAGLLLSLALFAAITVRQLLDF